MIKIIIKFSFLEISLARYGQGLCEKRIVKLINIKEDFSKSEVIPYSYTRRYKCFKISITLI